MICTGTQEDEEATMARFFNGLNIEVQDRVEMVAYYNIQELVHQPERAEQQVKRRQVSGTNSSSWRRPQQKTEDADTSCRVTTSTRSSSQAQKEAPQPAATNTHSTASSRDITCFKCGGRRHMLRNCPNEKRVLLTKEGNVSASDEEEVVNEAAPEEIEHHSAEDAAAYPALTLQRAQEDQLASSGHRWKIFQTQGQINDKDCKVVIDSGSYTNVITKHAVDVLGLSSWPHPRPHCVEWLYNSGRLKVTHKARVKFSIGSYHEMVVCDVVPMDICHLLLGRPWQYDAHAIHDGRSNTYTF